MNAQFKAEREARALAEGLNPANVMNNTANSSNNNNNNSNVNSTAAEPVSVTNKRRCVFFFYIYSDFLSLLFCILLVWLSLHFFVAPSVSQCLLLFIKYFVLLRVVWS